MKHPIQPTYVDGNGVIRFKENAIVRHLLEHGGIDLNDIAHMDFSQDDREQFAQLIGYSVDGFASLSYASAETIAAACRSDGVSDLQARYDHASHLLRLLRNHLREPIAELYGMHSDDLP